MDLALELIAPTTYRLPISRNVSLATGQARRPNDT